MSKRTDPNLGQRRGGDAPRRVRQMTVYDRLEDARKRRKELLAKGNGPAPRTPPSLRASNEPSAPKERTAPIAPAPIPPVAPVSAPPKPRAEAPVPGPRPEPRRIGGYWMGLLQAMVAIALIAALIAVFQPFGTEPEIPATAATPLQRETVAPAPIVQEPSPEPNQTIASFTVTTDGPTLRPTPEPTSLGLTIAPLISPVFETTPARLAPPAPRDAPFDPAPEAAPPLPANNAPVFLASTPPVRPVPDTATATPETRTLSGLAETTNVVLLVPAFVPQSDAEAAVSAAATLGIPVDQTRRASVSISRTNIRYFHAEDAEAATRLASALGGIARDFTNFNPPPSVGTIEVWLEGRGGSTSNRGSATARGIEADLEALRNSIARALNRVSGN